MNDKQQLMSDIETLEKLMSNVGSAVPDRAAPPTDAATTPFELDRGDVKELRAVRSSRKAYLFAALAVLGAGAVAGWFVMRGAPSSEPVATVDPASTAPAEAAAEATDAAPAVRQATPVEAAADPADPTISRVLEDPAAARALAAQPVEPAPVVADKPALPGDALLGAPAAAKLVPAQRAAARPSAPKAEEPTKVEDAAAEPQAAEPAPAKPKRKAAVKPAKPAKQAKAKPARPAHGAPAAEASAPAEAVAEPPPPPPPAPAPGYLQRAQNAAGSLIGGVKGLVGLGQ